MRQAGAAHEPGRKEEAARTSLERCQRPEPLKNFANSPAALKAAVACFAVLAMVVLVSVLLPPAALTIRSGLRWGGFECSQIGAGIN
jgi:hypothetical protein